MTLILRGRPWNFTPVRATRMFKRLRPFSAAVFLLAGVGALSAPATSASAEQMVWNIRSNHPKVVHIAFYSQNRGASWPGGGEVYVLDTYQVQTFNLNCRRGEKICYGAWVAGNRSTYWGVGSGDRNGCNDCCYVCGQTHETRVRTLNP